MSGQPDKLEKWVQIDWTSKATWKKATKCNKRTYYISTFKIDLT